MLPDFDFVPGLLAGSLRAYHRYAFHSVGAALLVGALVATWYRTWGRRWWPIFLVTSAIFASHVLLDAMSTDPFPPRGVQALWPISDDLFRFARPLLVFRGEPRNDITGGLLSWEGVRFLAVELLLIAPIVALAAALAYRRGRATRAPGAGQL